MKILPEIKNHQLPEAILRPEALKSSLSQIRCSGKHVVFGSKFFSYTLTSSCRLKMDFLWYYTLGILNLRWFPENLELRRSFGRWNWGTKIWNVGKETKNYANIAQFPFLRQRNSFVLIGNLFRVHRALHNNAISSGPFNLTRKDYAQIEHFPYYYNLIFSLLDVSFLFVVKSRPPDAGINQILL